MASSLEICNMALAAIGQDPIMSLEDNAKSARLCRQVYDNTKKSVLRAYPWTFAIHRAHLARELDGPVYGFENSFKLPVDCLRLVSVNLSDGEFKVERNRILTNFGAVAVRYVKNVSDESEMDAQFIEALATQLASKIVISLTNDSQVLQYLKQLYTEQILLAMNTQAIEDSQQEVIEGNWLTSRR